MTQIPDGLRSLAVHIGVPDDEVGALWHRHCELCDADESDYGGPRWEGLCRKAAKDFAAGNVRPIRAETVPRASASRPRRRSGLEPQPDAVSLPDWLESLRTKDPGRLTRAERALLAAGDPPERLGERDSTYADRVAKWMISVFAGRRESLQPYDLRKRYHDAAAHAAMLREREETGR